MGAKNFKKYSAKRFSLDYENYYKRIYFIKTKYGETSHRKNGPSDIKVNGEESWFYKGLRHRINGPAFIYEDGDTFWYIKGRSFSENEYWNI